MFHVFFLGGGNSDIFYFHPLPGEDSHLDEHIFQMGWFNHQLDFGISVVLHCSCLVLFVIRQLF